MEPLLSWPADDTGTLTRAEIVRWWESRRLRFNLYVGAVGLLSWLLVLIAGSAAVNRGVDFEEPIAMIIGPFVYGFMANLCYTLGWIVDTVQFRGVPRIKLYRTGVLFSIVLTGLPGMWAVIAFLMTLATGHKLE